MTKQDIENKKNQLESLEKNYIALLKKKKDLAKLKKEAVDQKSKITVLLQFFFVDVSIVNHSFLCLRLQLESGITKDYYRNELKKNIFELGKSLLQIFKKDRYTEVINSDIEEADKQNLAFFLEDENFSQAIEYFKFLFITFDRLILLFKSEEQKWYNYFLESQSTVFSIFKGMLDFSLVVMYSYPSNSKNYFDYEKAISVFYQSLNAVVNNQREAFTLRDSSGNIQEALHYLMLKQNFEKLILNDQEAYLETVKKYRKWVSLVK